MDEEFYEEFFENKYVTESQIYYVAARINKDFLMYLETLNKMIDNSRISKDIKGNLKRKFERELGKKERIVIKDEEFNKILTNITESAEFPEDTYFDDKIVKVSQIEKAMERLGNDSNNVEILFRMLRSVRSNVDIKKLLDDMYHKYDRYQQLEEQWDEQSQEIGEYKAIKEMIERLKKEYYSDRVVKEENAEINQEFELEPEESEQEDKEKKQNEQEEITNPFLKNLDKIDLEFIEVIQGVVDKKFASRDLIMNLANVNEEEAKGIIKKMIDLKMISSKKRGGLALVTRESKRDVLITQEQLNELKNLIETKIQEKINIQSEEQELEIEDSAEPVSEKTILETVGTVNEESGETKGETEESKEQVRNEPVQQETPLSEEDKLETVGTVNEEQGETKGETEDSVETVSGKAEEEENLEGEHKYSTLVEEIIKDRKSSEIEKVSRILEQIDDLDQENYQAEIKKVMETFGTEEGLKIGLINLGALMDEETKREIEERIKALGTNQQDIKTEDTKTENSDGEHTNSDKNRIFC